MKNLFKSLGFVLIALIMFNALLITGCNDDPSLDDPQSPPPPTATIAEIEFFPSSWGEEGEYRAEQWETNNQIKLASFFSSKKPKQGDVLSFKISGISNKDLKYIKIELGECSAGDWNTYNYLGSSWRGKDDGELVNLNSSFNNVLINVTITEPTNPNAAIYAQLVNLLWEKDPSGEYVFNSGEKLPENFKKGDVMATISNFKISLVKIDSTHNVENNYGWNIWRDNSSTATLNYSIADDGICTVTVGGTPEKHGEGDVWNAWKISAQYAYTGETGTCYEYKFEAWTQSGARNLHVQYYEDNKAAIYFGDTIPITTTRTTYTISGQNLPKGGKNNVSFQLADQVGTVNIKMLGVKEYTIGKLTITNFSGILAQNNYIDGYITIDDSSFTQLYAAASTSQVTQIKGNTIILNVWVVERDYDGNIISSAPYTGNGTASSLWINHMYSDGMDGYINKVPITFTNGNATINFATQMMLAEDEDSFIEP
jgi:hypothetical protein